MGQQQTSAATALPDPAALARFWIEELRRAERAVEAWHRRGDKVVRRYKDEREAAAVDERRLNLLWSNVETLTPVLYARTPKPVVTRRFLDRDPVGRAAADLLERATAANIDLYDFDAVLQGVVRDYLLPGRGAAWVRYQPEFGPEQIGVDGMPFRPLSYERVVADHVDWKDFLTSPARSWAEVRWVARRSWLTREEAVALSPEHGARVPLDHRVAPERDGGGDGPADKATVWEIWDRPSGEVWFIHPGYGAAPLKAVPAPFKLDGFFPCPRPLSATLAGGSLVPVPDYCLYQDQAEELDDLTGRIASLQKALKVVGVYDSSVAALQNLLGDGVENVMVPVDQWAMFAQKGGLAGAVSFLPVQQVAETLVRLYEARRQVKSDLYEITGISDILRGASVASETATAQSIKAQWGSIRVRDRQREVARFARDLVRLKAEVIAEVFSPDSIALMAGLGEMGPDYQQAFPAALGLLRQDAARAFRIEIETDSTVEPDENAEKQRRVEFLTALGGFVQQALPALQVAPWLAPMFGEALTWATRGFRAGRQLEAAIEQAMAQAVGALSASSGSALAAGPGTPPASPDPAAAKAAANAAADARRLDLEARRVEGQLALQNRKVEGELALKAAQLYAETGARPAPPGPPPLLPPGVQA
jgi:hypothetical protein